MNQFLDAAFSDEEIKKAAFDISPTKAPGPDGYSACFFHEAWCAIEPEVYKKLKEVLNRMRSPEEWNETVIALIPKKKKLEKMRDFCPISLCNIIYKIAAKAIANRWRKVLDEFIDVNQSVFIPGRLITDNILIAFECMH